MDSYIEVDEEYIKNWLNIKNSNDNIVNNSDIIEFIKKYYGPTSYKVVANYTNEYNDNDYDLRIDAIHVYHRNGEEIDDPFPDGWRDGEDKKEIKEMNKKYNKFLEEKYEIFRKFQISDTSSEASSPDLIIYLEPIVLDKIYIKS